MIMLCMVGDDSCEPAPTGTRDGGHPFSFPKIRSLYPSNLGQATPSALGHFRLAVTIYSIPSNQMLNHEVHLLNFRNLHVLASGASVPFLLTTGVAEGWAYSRHLTQQYFRVSDLQYSVAYN